MTWMEYPPRAEVEIGPRADRRAALGPIWPSANRDSTGPYCRLAAGPTEPTGARSSPRARSGVPFRRPSVRDKGPPQGSQVRLVLPRLESGQIVPLSSRAGLSEGFG